MTYKMHFCVAKFVGFVILLIFAFGVTNICFKNILEHNKRLLVSFTPYYSARNKDQKLVSHFLKIGYFIGY